MTSANVITFCGVRLQLVPVSFKTREGTSSSNFDPVAAMVACTVLILTLIYAGQTTAALSLWQPQFLKAFGLSTAEVGHVNVIPFDVAALAMDAGGRSSDRRDEHVWHTAVPAALTTLGLCLCLVLSGVSASRGPFWALTTG